MIRNNNGWGLKEMLFLSAIILLAVLVVAMLVNNLYSSLDNNLPNNTNSNNSNTSSSYEQIEKNLLSAAKKYYNSSKGEIGQIIISDELIEEKYLTIKKMTINNDICEGYVLINNDELTPYITCANYETEGY